MEDEMIVATILYNLRRKRILGGKHTHFDTLKKGFPVHLKGSVGKIAKDLISRKWIVTKPTSYGLQVSLNKNFIKGIEKFIFRVMGFRF